MKILFTWIEKYKCLEQVGVNLTPQYCFSYDPLLNELSYKYYPDDPSDIIYGDGISVSALIGNNGCGKSTYLHFLCEILTSPDEFNTTGNFVVWLDDFGVMKVSPNQSELQCKDENGALCPISVGDLYYADRCTVYYSDILDADVIRTGINDSVPSIAEHRFVDISSSCLLAKEAGYSYIDYVYNNVKREMLFFDKDSDDFPFDRPKELSVEMEYYSPVYAYTQLLDAKGQKRQTKFLESLNEFGTSIFKTVRDTKDACQKVFVANLFGDYLRKYLSKDENIAAISDDNSICIDNIYRWFGDSEGKFT